MILERCGRLIAPHAQNVGEDLGWAFCCFYCVKPRRDQLFVVIEVPRPEEANCTPRKIALNLGNFLTLVPKPCKRQR